MPFGFYSNGTATDTTWSIWTNDTTNTTTNNENDVWYVWASDGTGPTISDPPALSAEQIEASRQAVDERHQKREEAKERAQRLLVACLSEKQREEYERDRAFHVYAGNRRYRIRTGRAGNVDLIEEDRVRVIYCGHPIEDVPDEDTMLAQKLLIETDEEAFLEMANARSVA